MERGGELWRAKGDSEASVVEPGLAGLVEVEALHCLSQVIEEQDFAERLAAGRLGVIEVAGSELPAEVNQLVDEWLFDQR